MNDPSPGIKISVIIPVFRVEEYIETCIASLKAQTLREIEFIFVDDCGSDASMRFVEDFATEDSRVRIIRNPHNLGPGPSRNAGIEEARGEYLSFVDPDDWMSADFYKLLYQKGSTSKAYIIKGTRLRVESVNNSREDLKTTLYRRNSLLNKRIHKTQQHKVPLFCVFTTEHTTAIYHHLLFEDHAVRYGTSRNAEDTTFLLRMCLKQAEIKLENKAVYFYFQRNGSSTDSFSKKRAFEELSSFQEKVDSVRPLQDQMSKYEYAVFYLNQMLAGYYANACAARYQMEWNNNDIVRYEQYLKELMQQVEQLFPNHSDIYSQVPELCAVRDYGQWIPPARREGAVSYEDILQAWTVFLTKHPNANNKIYIQGYAKALIRTLVGIVVLDKEVGKDCSLKCIFLQLKELGTKQRRAVIFTLPHSILFFLRRKVRNSVYGFSK